MSASNSSGSGYATAVFWERLWRRAHSRFVSPIVGLAWALVVSGVILTRSLNTRAGC